MQSDTPDDFSILLLDVLPASITLYASERAWDASAGAFTGGEATVSYTPSSDVPAGTVLTLSDFTGPSTGLSSSGDHVHVFIGGEASPTFLCSAAFDYTGYTVRACAA